MRRLGTVAAGMAAAAATGAVEMPSFELGTGENAVRVPVVVSGCWQFAGGHGQLDSSKLVAAMGSLHAAGLYAFDTADIYGPSESIVGEYVGASGETTPVVFTKLVPRSNTASSATIAASIDRSIASLRVSALDLVQYHTWSYDRNFLKPLLELQSLQAAGKVRQIGLTNFDTPHMAQAIEAGLQIVSNQVQWSLLDRRPENTMLAFAKEHGVALLTYGTVGGGLLSDRWIGKPQPTSRAQLDTSSLSMYLYSRTNCSN